jgi:hypothetical protein
MDMSSSKMAGMVGTALGGPVGGAIGEAVGGPILEEAAKFNPSNVIGAMFNGLKDPTFTGNTERGPGLNAGINQYQFKGGRGFSSVVSD